MWANALGGRWWSCELWNWRKAQRNGWGRREKPHSRLVVRSTHSLGHGCGFVSPALGVLHPFSGKTPSLMNLVSVCYMTIDGSQSSCFQPMENWWRRTRWRLFVSQACKYCRRPWQRCTQVVISLRRWGMGREWLQLSPHFPLYDEEVATIA